MKKPLNYLCLIVFAFISLTIQAQDIKLPSPGFSKDLVSALKPSKGLGLSSGVSTAVEKENKSFASDVVGIMSGSGDDASKKLQINDRKKEREGVLGKAFGSDNALQSYKKDISKQIAPFKRKYKLASLVL